MGKRERERRISFVRTAQNTYGTLAKKREGKKVERSVYRSIDFGHCVGEGTIEGGKSEKPPLVK